MRNVRSTAIDLSRFACRHFGPEEQAKVIHNLIDSTLCFPIEFTTDQVEKIICQHMEASARRQLMKRLITESRCNGENKIISYQTVQALRTAIDGLTMLMGILSFLASIWTLLRVLTRSFTWFVRIVVWLDHLFDRIGVIEKYLEAIAIVVLGEFFDYLAELCEESPSASGLDTSALSDDLPELIAELSVIAENRRAKA